MLKCPFIVLFEQQFADEARVFVGKNADDIVTPLDLAYPLERRTRPLHRATVS